MMHGPWMFFRFFWIFPPAFFAMFLLRTFLGKRHRLSSSERVSSLAEQEKHIPSTNLPSAKIPKELKEAGQQILENLDWEIRFLEKQRLEMESPQERKKIEDELTRKREEYHTTAERLNL